MNYPTIAVIFNGPPRVGKDTLSRLIVPYLSGPVRITCFKEKLYDATFTRLLPEFQLFAPRDWWGSEKYDDLKDDPLAKLVMQDGFEGTARECLIHVSEDIIKPAFGAGYFGEMMADTLKPGYNIISDGGFGPELDPVIEAADYVVVVRLYKTGYTFAGDSRNYIDIDIEGAHPDLSFTDGILDGDTPQESAAKLGRVLIDWELSTEKLSPSFKAMRRWLPATYLETFS